MPKRTGLLAAAMFFKMLSVIVMVISVAGIILAIVALGDGGSYQTVLRLDQFANLIELIILGFLMMILAQVIEMLLTLEENLFDLARLVHRQSRQNKDAESTRDS